MLKHPALTRTRIQRYHDQIIKPHFYPQTAPLAISVFQCPDPIPYADAIRQEFRPIDLGFRFGPRWSTAWFHVTGAIPASFVGNPVVLRFKSDTEALVYVHGVPAQGMERNHDDFLLTPSAHGGEPIDLYIECGVNTFFGADGGSRAESRTPASADHPAANLPGHLHTCDLAILNPEVRALHWDLEFLRALEAKLPDASVRKRQLLRAMNDAINLLDQTNIPATASAARVILAQAIATPAPGSASQCFAVGHAHIDTAWLWPLRETVRKCSRTFATQCALMDEYPDYVFQSSQAQLYAFTQQHYPALFSKIKERVARGQWEPGGAMWIEADCNIPSGESLVRQILHGTNYWLDNFGLDRGQQSYLWLPDVFGYSAALPQILKQAGLDYFVTQKISWNQFNKFPHHTFYWQGIDGTKIFSHFLPADTYNASNSPDELIHGMENNQDADRANLYLTAFGYGDGGGGPTRGHIERIHRAHDCDGAPQSRLSRVDTFLRTLEQNATDLATWVGELYLELHRGTYTTQARNKAANRASEFLLHDAEFFAALRPDGPAHYPAADFDRAWKLVLLNQFHDIIPGSSITWVYEDSHDQYAEVRAAGTKILADAAHAWTVAIDTTSAKRPLVVFNTLSWNDSDFITLDPAAVGSAQSLRDHLGRVVSPLQKLSDGTLLARATDVPSLGYALFDLADQPAPLAPAEAATGSATSHSSVLENRLVRAEFDAVGRITRLFDKLEKRELVSPSAPANQLVLYEDRPNSWDAWDIDAFYLEKPAPVAAPAEIKLLDAGPLRATLLVTHKLGQASTLTQRISLHAESRRLDFATAVDWHEDHVFLRVLHPVNILSPRATYEIQFGHAERPTHFNTSWDMARFEVCAQKWADLAEGGGSAGYGVSLLNTGKYGHSCHGNILGLSLLRAPTNPDKTADRGRHAFTYALLPHPGDFRDVGTIHQAYRLNTPLKPFPTTTHAGKLGPKVSLLYADQPNVIIDTVKKAERSNDLIIRLYESHGRRNPATLHVFAPFQKAEAVDLLECPTSLYTIRQEGRAIHMDLTPFALRTIALRTAAAPSEPRP